MPYDFSNYKVALLDTAFFVSSFPQNVRDGLQDVQVWISETFDDEINQYKKVLSAEKLSVYEENIRFLNQNIYMKRLNFESFGERTANTNSDMWGFISLLISLKNEYNAEFVVLTANKLLMQRIIVNELEIDIYDLNNQVLYHYKDYHSRKNLYDFSRSFPPITQSDVSVNNGSVLYSETGEQVLLGTEIKSGLEASICKVEGSNCIAKVFKKDRLEAGKFQNIKNLVTVNNNVDVDWAVFPKSLLYYDYSRTLPAGFVEQYVATEGNLDNNPLFLGDVYSIPEEYLQKRISYLVDLCLRVVRQVCYLNTLGFYVSDYNLGNFSFIENRNDVVQMWDTDSFGYQSFFGSYYSPYHVDNCNHVKYNINTPEGAIGSSNDALYQFVFHLLSLGDTPISQYTGKFKYDKPTYHSLYRKGFFPKNIWSHMEEVFRGIKPPSAEALMKHLALAKSQYDHNVGFDKTIRELLQENIRNYEEIRREHLNPEKTTVSASKSSCAVQGNITNASMGSNTTNNVVSSTNNSVGYAGNTTNTATNSIANTTTNSITNTTVNTTTGILTYSGSGNNSNYRRARIKREKIKKTILLCLIIIVFIILVYYCFFNDTDVLPRSSKAADSSYFTEKSYVGYTEQEAIKDIKEHGWNVKSQGITSFEHRKGDVISSYCDSANKEVVITVSDGPYSEKLLSSGINIYVNKSEVFLSEGGHVELSISSSGEIEKTYDVSFGYDHLPEGVTAEWGDWLSNNTVKITLTANSKCEGYVRFYLYYENSAKCYADVYVNVK